MDTTYGFSLKRRMKTAAPPLAIAAVIALALAIFGKWSTWQAWVALGIIVLILIRPLSYLLWSRRTVRMDSKGLTRSGRTIPWKDAQVELRTQPEGAGHRLREAVLWAPATTGGGRTGVGFDDSLERFELAVRDLLARVPETAVVVSSRDEKDVRGPAREKLLERLRPTAAERALVELGPGVLSVPPHLRS
jgi:hypothetical protein